jgi:hypothetical protein
MTGLPVIAVDFRYHFEPERRQAGPPAASEPGGV